MSSIIAGFDGSPGARVALSWAVREGRLRGVPLRVMTFAEGGDQPELPRADAVETVRAQLAPIVAELSVTCTSPIRFITRWSRDRPRSG